MAVVAIVRTAVIRTVDIRTVDIRIAVIHIADIRMMHTIIMDIHIMMHTIIRTIKMISFIHLIIRRTIIITQIVIRSWWTRIRRKPRVCIRIIIIIHRVKRAPLHIVKLCTASFYIFWPTRWAASVWSSRRSWWVSSVGWSPIRSVRFSFPL